MLHIDLTGQDWRGAPRYFAQRGSGFYAFGDTPTEALMHLWLLELGQPVPKHREWHPSPCKTVVRYMSGSGWAPEEGWYFGRIEYRGGPMFDPVGPYATRDECLSDIPKGANT